MSSLILLILMFCLIIHNIMYKFENGELKVYLIQKQYKKTELKWVALPAQCAQPPLGPVLQDMPQRVIAVFGHSDFFHRLTGRDCGGEWLGHWMENGEVSAR